MSPQRRTLRSREPDPLSEVCPFCEFSGPRTVVYRHVERAHPEFDPADVFDDPVGIDRD